VGFFNNNSLEIRELIYRHHVANNKTPYEIHFLLFNSDNNLCSIKHLIAICAKLDLGGCFISNYTSGGARKTGRPFSLDYMQRSLIQDQIHSDKDKLCSTMFNNYCRMFYPNNDGPIRLSLSTFKRTLKRIGFTRKIMERRHIHQDPLEGVHYLETIEHINPLHIIDVDETKNNPESFFQKHGYAPEGDVCTKEQIMINGVAYCTIAAVTPLGFLCWQIFEGNIGHLEFTNFLTITLAPYLIQENVLILDNASIHHVPDCRIILEELMHGNYIYSARYSPHLKPIEPCFALVKNWIRDHEDEAVQNPIDIINLAFNLFAIGGAKAHSIMGHWNGYFSNHNAFLEQINA